MVRVVSDSVRALPVFEQFYSENIERHVDDKNAILTPILLDFDNASRCWRHA